MAATAYTMPASPRPTAYERLMDLPSHWRRVTYLALALAYEHRSAEFPKKPCSCGRGNAASEWCVLCWQEMYELALKLG